MSRDLNRRNTKSERIDEGTARTQLRNQSNRSQFGIDFDYDVGATLLTLHGELDALSVPAFAAVLTSLVDRGVRTVTIDLGDLRFCNIGGLRAMAELAARVHADDGCVRIVSPEILTRMLALSDLQSLFDIVERPARVTSGATDDLELDIASAAAERRPGPSTRAHVPSHS